MPSSCLKIDRSRTRQNTPDTSSSSSSSSAEAAAVPMAPLVDIDRSNQFHHNARWWILCSCCRCLSKSRWAERRAVTQVALWWPSIGQDGCNQPCLIAVQQAGSTIEASAVRTEFTLWRQAIKCCVSRVKCSFWHNNLVTLQYYCIFLLYLLAHPTNRSYGRCDRGQMESSLPQPFHFTLHFNCWSQISES